MPRVVTRVLISGRGRLKRSEGKRRDGRSSVRERSCVAGFGGGGRSHGLRKVGDLGKLGKARQWSLPSITKRESVLRPL